VREKDYPPDPWCEQLLHKIIPLHVGLYRRCQRRGSWCTYISLSLQRAIPPSPCRIQVLAIVIVGDASIIGTYLGVLLILFAAGLT